MKVLYFGVLAEIKGMSSEFIQFEAEVADLDQLKEKVFALLPDAQSYVFRIAVNNVFVNNNRSLTADDEIAFMPPFSGG